LRIHRELAGSELAAYLVAAGHAERQPQAELRTTRRVFLCPPVPPCLPDAQCDPVGFTYGTLPMRPFSGGHTWFNQNVGTMEGHTLPQYEPVRSWQRERRLA